MKTIGIILIVVGILMAVFRGFSVTTEKEVADIGPLEINKKKTNGLDGLHMPEESWLWWELF